MLLPFWLFRERILIKRFLYLGGKARGGMNILYNFRVGIKQKYGLRTGRKTAKPTL
ncbi:hypothetical protein CORMATOL_03108 [Corynebacterium matruchotii ATCC 33806]|uniref:Uncharacterized protein n=2 Tax=Corynebacterium matruchotii TaxID=43768 RepID=A0A8B4H9D5_9CORY|nr:hypothetical protein CORMATOL_03108 [Corynebacterium matruchotii ATCC 33806]SPW31351.1 Uncharacterised protein [Corynebacterium matruchotii]